MQLAPILSKVANKEWFLCKIIASNDWFEMIRTGFVPDQPSDKEEHPEMAARISAKTGIKYHPRFIHCARGITEAQEKAKKFYKGQQFHILILDEEKLANAGFKLVIEKNQGGEREYPHLYRTSPDMLIPQSAIAEFTGEYSQLPQ